jgi:hypothetical protein
MSVATSGTVPFFENSTSREETPIVVTITGVSGVSTGTHSTEALQDFFDRAGGILAISGVRSLSGATSGLQCFSGSVVSGLQNLRRELAFRQADLEFGAGYPNETRIARVNAILAASGDVQLGS